MEEEKIEEISHQIPLNKIEENSNYNSNNSF